LQWAAFCVHAQTEEGVKDLEELEKLQGGGSRDWVMESVDSSTNFSVTMSKSFVAMTAADYRAEFGRAPPGTRGPKMQRIMLPVQGEDELVEHYLFADADAPHKKVTISTQLSNTRTSHVLPAAGNLYETQGKHMYRAASSSTAARADNADLFGKAELFKTVSEHMEKVAPELWQQRFGSTETVEPAESPTNDDGPTTRQVATSKFGRALSFGAMSSPALKGKPPSAVATAHTSLHSSLSSVHDDLGPGDSASQISGGDMGLEEDDDKVMAGKMKNLTSSQRLAFLKQKLPLELVMTGEKLGRSERAVKVHLNSGSQFLDGTEMKLLRNYMKQVDQIFDLVYAT
jgi:hypothetical protein